MQKLINLFSPIYKYIITALLLVIPLFPKFPAIKISKTYVAIRLEDFLILIAILIFLIPLTLNFRKILSNNVSRAIFLYLFVGLVSLVAGIYLTQTVDFKIGFLHWIRRIEYLSLFFIGFVFIKKYTKNSDFFNYLIKVLLVINLIVFLYGFSQKYFGLPIITTQNEEYSKGIALYWTRGAHINSTFAGHYDLASYLVLIIPIFISAFFYFKDKISKIILVLSIVIGFWLFSAAASRISIVAFLVATTISLFLLKKYKEIFIVLIISVLFFGLSSDLRLRYERIIDVIKEKMSAIYIVRAQEKEENVKEDRSTSIRLNVEWPRAIRAFQKNPLLGTGYSSITLATDNDYLRALGETGILGLLSFILIFYSMYFYLSRFTFSNSIGSIFIASFIGSSIGALLIAVFIDIFEASKFATIYWLFAGFAIGKVTKI